MNKILEEFKDFITEEQVRLDPVEDRGDDLGSSRVKNYKYEDLSLFLLSLKTAPDGFIEAYCLDKNVKERLKKIRNKQDIDKEWKKKIIAELEKYLPITYRMFMYLSLDDQLDVIKSIKLKFNEEELERFNNKFNNLLDPEKKSLNGSCYINYRILVGNAFYAKEAKYLEYKDITKYKEILYQTLTEEYRYVMFEDGNYDFLEIKNSLFIKEKGGIRLLGDLDEVSIESVNSIYPDDIQELIKKSRDRFRENPKQLIKKS